ncbi:MAG TPA: protein kinase [Candidatus Eisenbacteria bacterium]|nr:protein kinase [Candidatus Eisenbacteria bacterium]
MIGQTVGRYRILEQLGQGGMGVVYRAHDPELERDVALKFLSGPASEDETARMRLLREARSISALNHPHICHVYEIGSAGGRAFIAMEMVPGRSLAASIPPQGLPSATVLRYGRQIASALAHAHERGVVHRDLKSANVMITPEGDAKVLDFGLARQLAVAGEHSAELTLTGEGTVVGTPGYLAPEVLRGEKSGPASDLWALGVVLFEMITGRLPFRGKTLIEVATSILNDDPPPLPERTPAGLRSIVARCLAKEPARRYRSAGEVMAALEAVQTDSSDRMHAMAAGGAGVPRALLWVAAIVFLLTIGAGVYFARGRIFGSGTQSRAATIRSLAVLPLANLSGDPGQDYFADGMTEELITSLTPLRDLKVISRTSVMRYKGTREPMAQIARELGVDGIVEGSVTRAGDRVRVTAQLVDAAEDKHLWARSYERKLEQVLSLQREIAGDIAQEIQIQLSPALADARRGNHPLNTEAYELYLKGDYELAKMTSESARQAEDYFNQAIVLDPDNARFYAGIANANVIEGHVLGSVSLDVAMPKAKAAASRALALDPNLAEAHTAEAIALFFVDWDWKGAEEHARRGIELDPGYSNGHFIYAVILGAQGRTGEALRENRRALELDPLSLMNNWHLISVLGEARQFDEAVAQAHRALDLFPGSPLLERQLAGVSEWRGDFRGAIDAVRTNWPESMGGEKFVKALDASYASAGEPGYCRTWIELLKKAPPKEVAYRMAEVYAMLGDADQTFAWLRRAVDGHNGDVLWVNVDPHFDPLRRDPRFAEIVRAVGLRPAS